MPSETYNGREKFEFATKKRVRFFNTAIDAIFKNWHALQMAVAHVSNITLRLGKYFHINIFSVFEGNIFNMLIEIFSASWRRAQ